MIGEVVGNYRIASEIGQGGMGMVYRAEHTQLGRPVAIKMLLPQMSADPTIVQRFFNEARAASAIDHPGIVEVHDFGKHTDGRAYIVMALLKGESLDHRLLHGALPSLEAASIVAQVAAALAAAHARGIVHRDLKPDNIFLVPNELMPNGVQVKLLDFGIAKLADEKAAGFKTQTGMLIGTPAYMSPEQCMGRSDLDHRTDLYSLGCILFHVLTGRPPFISDQGTGVMLAAHMRDPAPHPRSIAPHIPDNLAAITMRLLEKDPAARFQSATELRNALVAAGASAPITRSGVDQYMTPAAPAPPYRGSQAFAQTTHGSAAAQVVTQPRRSSRAILWLGAGIVIAAGVGVGIFVGTQADSVEPPPPATAETTAPPAPAPPTPAATPVPPPPHPVAAADCTDGKTSGGDTQGHCCWREQAWSSSKNRCVGTPVCPPGRVAKDEQCVATAVVEAPPQQAAGSGAVIATSATPTFQLDAKTYRSGSDVRIRFAAPVRSPAGHRAWVTVVEAGKPATSYGAWTFVDDRATTATLRIPNQPGAFEVRLHTDYPVKQFNVAQVVPFTAVAGTTPLTPEAGAADITPLSKQRFTTAATNLTAGGNVEILFPSAMRPVKGEQFWITIVGASSGDTSWGAYEYVPDRARSMRLKVPIAPGDYEIRLHANYPKKTTNVVHRIGVHVD